MAFGICVVIVGLLLIAGFVLVFGFVIFITVINEVHALIELVEHVLVKAVDGRLDGGHLTVRFVYRTLCALLEFVNASI